MKIRLRDGREAVVTVRFNEDVDGYRETVATMFIQDHGKVSIEDAYVGGARCSPNDNFERATGRKLAAGRMLNALRRDGWHKEDRQAVFDAICPEYRRKATTTGGAR